MYKTIQLYTNTFTFNTNKFTSINVIKKPIYRHKVIKNAKLIRAWIKLKLFIGLNEPNSLFTDIFQVSLSFSLKHGMKYCLPYQMQLM